LCDDGIVRIPNFVPTTAIRAMVREIESRTPIFEPGQPVSDIGSIIFNGAERFEVLNEFFTDPRIRAWAWGYVSGDVEFPRKQILLKTKVLDEAYSDFFHVDHWEYKLRAYLFLEDLGEDNAPIHYLAGSHELRPWRLRKEYEIFRHFEPTPKDVRYANPHSTAESKYCGICLPPEAHAIRTTWGYEEIVATGPAGTLLLFDARGLHRSSVLRAGRRLVLGMHIDRRSQGYFMRTLGYEGQG
jgi:hypothetical protein